MTIEVTADRVKFNLIESWIDEEYKEEVYKAMEEHIRLRSIEKSKENGPLTFEEFERLFEADEDFVFDSLLLEVESERIIHLDYEWDLNVDEPDTIETYSEYMEYLENNDDSSLFEMIQNELYDMAYSAIIGFMDDVASGEECQKVATQHEVMDKLVDYMGGNGYVSIKVVNHPFKED